MASHGSSELDGLLATSLNISTMTKAYQYPPLAHDKQQIRVLRFEQGQPDDDHLLRFKLEILTLHTDLQEPYYAISYAWGENPGLAPIIMDGREALVPDSAEEALRGILRAIRTDESHQATLIWIDAVCINQDDLEEKSHQVAMMGRVFAKAHLVFSWLGPDDGTTPAAIQSFEALQRQYRQLTGDQHDLNYLFNLPRYHCENLPFMRVAPPATCDRRAGLSFLRCRYFTRLWIVQGMFVVKRIFIINGTHAMTLQIFEEAILWTYLHDISWFFSPQQFVDELISRCTLCIPRRQLQNGKDLHLSQRLDLATMYQTSNAWDKVYALLGMTHREGHSSEESIKGKIVPDYGKDLLTVYREATSTAITSEKSLLVLDLAAGSVPYLESDYDWPSWVPRLHIIAADQIHYLSPPVARVHANQQAVVHIGHEASNELHVQGVCVGEVVNLLDLEGNSNTTLLEWLVGVWSADLDTTNPKNTAAALVNGDYHDLHVNYATDLLPDFMAFTGLWKDQCSPSTRFVLSRHVSKLGLRQGDANAFGHKWRFRNRIIFQLSDGRVGVTFGKLTRGDHICILFGGWCAFVLRQEGPSYKIQGLAYIPGTEKGEYIEQLRAEGRLEEETQTFILT